MKEDIRQIDYRSALFTYGSYTYIGLLFSTIVIGCVAESIQHANHIQASLWLVFTLSWLFIFATSFANTFLLCRAMAKSLPCVSIYPARLVTTIGGRQITRREIVWLDILATVCYSVGILFYWMEMRP